MIKKLLMLAILAFAVVMAVPSTRAEFQARVITPIMDSIGVRLVPRRLDAMANQLDVRLSRAERLPVENFGAWIRMDYTGPDFDPWGNPWFLRVGRRDYTVGSMGPDGKAGTDDDIIEVRRMDRPPR